MSSVYSLEPPTQGKVILATNFGEIEIELWSKEAPKATRNFVQLCLEGYYHNTIFHRVIKDFIVQGGDPTGAGTGGESIYGKPFRDEFHSRLRFSHRGIVACANENQKHTNGSQFFITLSECEFLNKKHTIFGKIVGDTFFNAQRIGEVDVDGDDRPIDDPPTIISTEVLWNPFDDIVPREIFNKQKQQDEIDQNQNQTQSLKSLKNLNLLSFGDEEQEDEEEVEIQNFGAKGMVSAHDLLRGDERLEQVDEETEKSDVDNIKQKLQSHNDEVIQKQRQQIQDGEMTEKQLSNLSIKQRMQLRAQKGFAKVSKNTFTNLNDSSSNQNLDNQESQTTSQNQTQERNLQKQQIQQDQQEQQQEFQISQQNNNDQQNEEDQSQQQQQQQKYVGPIKRKWEEYFQEGKTTKRLTLPQDVPNSDLLTPYQASLKRYKANQKVRGKREKQTINNLNSFLTKLRTDNKLQPQNQQEQKLQQQLGLQQYTDEEEEQEEKIEKQSTKAYDGEIRDDIDHNQFLPGAWRVEKYIDDEDEVGGFNELFKHRVQFPATQAGGDKDDDYMTVDPLLDASFNKLKNKQKKKQNEWAGKSRT